MVIFWFRRDLRVEDNHGLFKALTSGESVLPVFVFDTNIINKLPKSDSRLTFIHDLLSDLNNGLASFGGGLTVRIGNPQKVISKLVDEHQATAVYTNLDHEPYGIERDEEIKQLLKQRGVDFRSYLDHAIRGFGDVRKGDGGLYTVFTPYYNKWLSLLAKSDYKTYASELHLKAVVQHDKKPIPSLEDVGFKRSDITVKPYVLSDNLDHYDETRDFPSLESTSQLGPHLRFGTISVREVIRQSLHRNEVFVKEVVWREFFMQILFHNPRVINSAFKPPYDDIPWNTNEEAFKKWCEGKTGYPMVDAGMRELNATGYMHNRLRMITASFLCKHLLIDWRLGEAYFAERLLDFELSSNNGNWQWAAGCGCDAAPYFRVFNPTTQLKKFDPEFRYIRKWVPEFGSNSYPKPMVDHKTARENAINTYKEALG
ncbi:MAG: deoxyribodipyrimidine photo-lyase [Bacteroidia bacterium]|nr:deoxyribodipyrimidine photo-lyase [Bacteroidia bacterium]